MVKILMGHEDKDHDPAKCFNCRLHALVDEMYGEGGPTDEHHIKYALSAIASAAAIMLSRSPDRTTLEYLMLILHVRDTLIEAIENEAQASTQH